MYLPADGAPESMVKLYVVSGYAIDPRLMDAHREERFSVPLIKQVYPGVTVYNYAKQFHEDIWKRFGLTESACRLLHRMQASDAPPSSMTSSAKVCSMSRAPLSSASSPSMITNSSPRISRVWSVRASECGSWRRLPPSSPSMSPPNAVCASFPPCPRAGR